VLCTRTQETRGAGRLEEGLGLASLGRGSEKVRPRGTWGTTPTGPRHVSHPNTTTYGFLLATSKGTVKGRVGGIHHDEGQSDKTTSATYIAIKVLCLVASARQAVGHPVAAKLPLQPRRSIGSTRFGPLHPLLLRNYLCNANSRPLEFGALAVASPYVAKLPLQLVHAQQLSERSDKLSWGHIRAGQSEGPERSCLRNSGPMIDAGVPSTKELNLYSRKCARPTGVVMVALPEVPRNASRAQSEGRAPRGAPKSAAEGHYRGRGPAEPRPGCLLLRGYSSALPPTLTGAARSMYTYGPSRGRGATKRAA
jgi:hypothetical protein